jgi:hypothetical protein
VAEVEDTEVVLVSAVFEVLEVMVVPGVVVLRIVAASVP